ncbi:methionyl-tRNA formyltransferase [Aliikangiella marina]|uniref:Methionyl-tRNA formyltransferase n=1 Tax=Aliikangiella marina TaxID=1712262 RepID=A0A545T1D8_9GAMM|nr:methionyl-tRNA formyltransferase [Aliikangiella marina]TQV71030.1 methionyl-tRNA formyltransferase [Aliikangiella marina]
MSDQKLKIIFAGTPEFAAVALKALIDEGHDICAVYCQPDRPSGRGKKLQAGPVKQLALDNDIPVEQPVNFKDPAAVTQLASYHADLMVVVAYGLLLPKAVLDIPQFGCVNIHGSILPRWRGAAPIHRAIEAGDETTGITIMQMDEGLDTGNMLLVKQLPIDATETGSSLHDKLAQLGGEAINQFLANFNPNNLGEVQDDDSANYAHKLHKAEAEIDWQQAAVTIERKVRAFNAWPVCFSYVGEKRLRVWQSALLDQASNKTPGTVVELSKAGIDVVCGDGQLLRLQILQPDGSKAMNAEALLNARRDWFETHPVLGRHD